MQIQKTINDQKRAMADQKKAQAEALENLQRAQEELDKSIKDINVEVEVDADESPRLGVTPRRLRHCPDRE